MGKNTQIRKKKQLGREVWEIVDPTLGRFRQTAFIDGVPPGVQLIHRQLPLWDVLILAHLVLGDLHVSSRNATWPALHESPSWWRAGRPGTQVWCSLDGIYFVNTSLSNNEYLSNWHHIFGSVHIHFFFDTIMKQHLSTSALGLEPKIMSHRTATKLELPANNRPFGPINHGFWSCLPQKNVKVLRKHHKKNRWFPAKIDKNWHQRNIPCKNSMLKMFPSHTVRLKIMSWLVLNPWANLKVVQNHGSIIKFTVCMLHHVEPYN